MSMNQLLLLHVLALTLNCLYASLFSTVSLDERQIPPNLVSAFLCIIASIYTYIYWQNTRKYVDHGSWRTLRERKQLGWGYTHDGRADNYPYPHDRRADKDSYPHDRNVTDDLCSLIKLCFAFIMVNFST